MTAERIDCERGMVFSIEAGAGVEPLSKGWTGAPSLLDPPVPSRYIQLTIPFRLLILFLFSVFLLPSNPSFQPCLLLRVLSCLVLSLSFCAVFVDHQIALFLITISPSLQ